MRRGSIVLVPFPFTDLSGQKVRPALVLASQPKSKDFIVAFISSVSKQKGSDTDVSVLPSPTNGLKVPSVVKVNKLATLQKNISLGEIGSLESKNLSAISQQLRKIFGL